MNLDHRVFGVYLAIVATVGILASRKKEGSDDYFLASRSLTWWIIGGSMIAANISTHHFIGMSGRAYEIGLAIASFEWLAAIALVLYGKFFLPYYLKTRITTMPGVPGAAVQRQGPHRQRHHQPRGRSSLPPQKNSSWCRPSRS